MSQIPSTPNATAATDPQAPTFSPDQFTTGLRALMAQVPAVPTLSRKERLLLQRNRHASDSEVQAAINVVQASEKVAGVVDEKTDEIQVLLEENNRWTAAENELKAALKKLSDANLVRQERVTAFAIQTYGIGTQLAKRPENSELVPHVQEIKRLRSRRRKTATSGTPTPTPVPTTPAPAPPAQTLTRKS
jgi:D-serine deaminase-like pyridoxal phosphate-dependent protein